MIIGFYPCGEKTYATVDIFDSFELLSKMPRPAGGWTGRTVGIALTDEEEQAWQIAMSQQNEINEQIRALTKERQRIYEELKSKILQRISR